MNLSVCSGRGWWGWHRHKLKLTDFKTITSVPRCCRGRLLDWIIEEAPRGNERISFEGLGYLSRKLHYWFSLKRPAACKSEFIRRNSLGQSVYTLFFFTVSVVFSLHLLPFLFSHGLNWMQKKKKKIWIFAGKFRLNTQLSSSVPIKPSTVIKTTRERKTAQSDFELLFVQLSCQRTLSDCLLRFLIFKGLTCIPLCFFGNILCLRTFPPLRPVSCYHPLWSLHRSRAWMTGWC